MRNNNNNCTNLKYIFLHFLCTDFSFKTFKTVDCFYIILNKVLKLLVYSRHKRYVLFLYKITPLFKARGLMNAAFFPPTASSDHTGSVWVEISHSVSGLSRPDGDDGLWGNHSLRQTSTFQAPSKPGAALLIWGQRSCRAELTAVSFCLSCSCPTC